MGRELCADFEIETAFVRMGARLLGDVLANDLDDALLGLAFDMEGTYATAALDQ
jgi:hypothetical protein